MLKTLCELCIFKQSDNSCLLTKDTFIKNKKQYTYGFCRHKRNIKWLEQGNQKKLNDIIRSIDDEEIAISTIVISIDNDINKILYTVDKLSQNELVKQIIIVLYKSKETESLIIGLKNIKIPWSITNILGEDKPDALQAVDHTSPEVKHHWFFPLQAGDEILPHEKLYIYHSLKSNTNIVAAYVDINDPIKVLTNKFAFIEMEGHYHQPWLEKVRQFDNWENVCIKMQPKCL
jgi:hypothetical protein